MIPSTSASVRSRLASGAGSPSVQNDATCPIPGAAASCAVSARPRAVTVGSVTEPLEVRTSRIRFGSLVWNVLCKRSAARLDSELGSLNPPEDRCWATLLPNAPARTTKPAETTRMIRLRRTVKRASLPSIPIPLRR